MKSLLHTLLVYCFFLPFQVQSQDSLAPILFIYDASGSMWGQMEGKTKMAIASEVLSTAVGQLPEGQSIGLIAYGHRKKGDCEDVELLVNLDNDSKDLINNSLSGIKPLGKTPLAYSAQKAINMLRENKRSATIILITDGIESCDGDICAVIKAAKEEGIEFKLHIIGFGLKEGEVEQLKCAAEAGDGQYYDAVDAGELGQGLEQATGSPVDEPPGTFSVVAIKNGEAIDAVVKALVPGTTEVVDEVRTYGDTSLLALPPGKYDLKTIPLGGSDVESITLIVESKADEIVHQTVSFDAASLEVMTYNNEEGWDAVVKMIDPVSGKTVASTRTYGRSQQMEVNPGTYNVYFKALALKGLKIEHTIENVTVQAGAMETVEHRFHSGIANVGVKTGNELVDAIVKLKEVNSGRGVASGRTYTSDSSNPKSFMVNPGTYEVSIMTLGKHKGHSDTFTLVVEAGKTVEKIFDY